jgi:hypothetical protein
MATSGRQWRTLAALAAVLALTALACTSGDEEGDGTTTTATERGSTEGTGPVESGPAPGVTADSIKIGITYVDTDALVGVGLDYDLGDHEAVYRALIDDINESGGIHGRQLEPVFAPIDPTGTASAEQSCLQMTEDDDVFMITGFLLGDAVLCPVETHETAVVGGQMTPERLERAAAPWITWQPDSDMPETVVRTFEQRGELDGTVGLFGAVADEAEVDRVEAVLEDLGVEVAEKGISDAPVGDTAAIQAAVKVIAQRYQAAGVDRLVVVGASGANWLTSMADDASYRPALRFTGTTAALAFSTSEATTDTSILEGSLAGGPYGPAQAMFDEEAMQECIGVLSDAGIETPTPEESGDDPSNQPYQAAFQACPDIALLRAALEAAGEDLGYGTLEAAIDGLEVHVPGDPTPRTFGPAPAGDGDPAAYLFAWDEGEGRFALDEG